MLKYKIPQIVTLILNPSGFYVDPKLTGQRISLVGKLSFKRIA